MLPIAARFFFSEGFIKKESVRSVFENRSGMNIAGNGTETLTGKMRQYLSSGKKML